MLDLLSDLERKYNLRLTNQYGEPNAAGRAILDGDAEVRGGKVVHVKDVPVDIDVEPHR